MTGAWARRLPVLALTLAVQAAPPAPAAAVTRAAQQPLLPRGKRSGLQARVTALPRALGLDADQQAALHALLVEQRRQVQRIWSDPALSAADRVAASRKVSQQTADGIRALLNEEQRRSYDPAPPSGPDRRDGGAQVERWMNAERKQEAQRQQQPRRADAGVGEDGTP